jgi:hypothetical protein
MKPRRDYLRNTKNSTLLMVKQRKPSNKNLISSSEGKLKRRIK